MSGLGDFIGTLFELETNKILGEKSLDKACENLANNNTAENRAAVDKAYNNIWENVGSASI